MKKYLIILTSVIATVVNPSLTFAQLQRSDAFHQKYKLKSVVVFSRHNLRAPNKGSQVCLQKASTRTWADWTANFGELTLKGGVLETEMGQFFRKWTASEGLLSENVYDTSAEDSVCFYANSMQRTIATARYFLAGFMPVSKLSVTWKEPYGSSQREFSTSLIDDDDLEQAQSEVDYYNATDTLTKMSESCEEAMKLLSDVVDFKNSEMYKSGEEPDFGENPNHNTKFVIKDNTLTFSSSSIGTVFYLADPLILQSYLTGDTTAFGKPLTYEQWRSIGRICDLAIGSTSVIPTVYKLGAQLLLDSLNAELRNDSRKFYFMCGHDINIDCILDAMEVEDFTLEKSIETHVPIGAKIVFEKWVDDAGKEYVGLNYVYQSVDQIRKAEQLTLDNPPMVMPLNVKSLTTNEDGLYQFEEFTDFIDHVDSFNSVNGVKADNVAKASGIYNAAGMRVGESATGLLIVDGKKIVK